MRSVVVVVTGVLFHQPSQVALIQHNYMIEQVTTAVANPALGNAVLPRTSEAGPFRLHCHQSGWFWWQVALYYLLGVGFTGYFLYKVYGLSN